MATIQASAKASSALRLQRTAVPVPSVRARRALQARALLGPDGKPSSGTPAPKKFLSREQEPEQYWTSKSEAPGANPFKDPLAIIGIISIFFPFILLAVASGTGLIDWSNYRGN